MSVITICRGSFSQGKRIAEKVAERLGYDCVSREILLAASDTLNVPEARLAKAVNEAPSIVDRFSKEKEKFIRSIRAALLNYVKQDNIVYHGLFGQFFLKDISHVLKVRIQMDIERRVAILMEQEALDESQAMAEIERRDTNIKKWGRFLYDMEPQHPNLHDLVVNVGNMDSDDVIDLICYTAELTGFQTTDDSRKKLNDAALEADIFSLLIDLPAVEVHSDNGNVQVQMKAPLNQSDRYYAEIRDLTRKMKEIKNLELVFA